MAQNTDASNGRTETERFTDDVSAAGLIEGDRISPDLVARHPDQLGQPIRRTMPNEEGLPDTQLVVATAINRYDDVHSAILVDVDEGLFVRASRHDSNQAWTQKEADWTVREVGSKVAVDEVDDLERPEQEMDESEIEYAQTWVEILFDEFRGGHFDLNDERDLSGTTLKLRDFDGRKLTCSIHLEE